MSAKIWAQIQALMNYRKCQSSTESKFVFLFCSKCSAVTDLTVLFQTIFICIYMYMHTYICIYRYKYIKEGKRLAGTSPWEIFAGGQNQVVYKTHLRWYKPLVSSLDLTEGRCTHLFLWNWKFCYNLSYRRMMVNLQENLHDLIEKKS